VDWTAIVTAIGTLLGGLALPLAFIQLGALRQDRLRAQINKVGAWADDPLKVDVSEQVPADWKIPLAVRNSSELPIVLQDVIVAVQPRKGTGLSIGASDQPIPLKDMWGPEVILATLVILETVAPGDTWRRRSAYYKRRPHEPKMAPRPVIVRIAVTDAAGRSWEIRRAGPPRRVTWWRQIRRDARLAKKHTG
jgi:hypothetical protein